VYKKYAKINKNDERHNNMQEIKHTYQWEDGSWGYGRGGSTTTEVPLTQPIYFDTQEEMDAYEAIDGKHAILDGTEYVFRVKNGKWKKINLRFVLIKKKIINKHMKGSAYTMLVDLKINLADVDRIEMIFMFTPQDKRCFILTFDLDAKINGAIISPYGVTHVNGLIRNKKRGLISVTAKNIAPYFKEVKIWKLK
jgi:hypothetical protein